MTATSALAYALLKGETVSIMTAFKRFGITNAPREIGRAIERKFDVEVHRVPVKFKSTYGHTGEYYRYTLLRTSKNRKGMTAMKKYVQEQMSK
jgi:hypothetical protein